MKVPGNTADKGRFVDELFAWLARQGATNYDISVTQLEHALQTAHLASQEGADRFQVVASLLHDVGHLLIGEHAGAQDFLKSDGNHEICGSRWLDRHFGERVSEPVRLHVFAKRWLYTRDADYGNRLSDASRRSLELQGGRLDARSCVAFEAAPYWREAVALRLRDDYAKQAGLEVPGLEAYREIIMECLVAGEVRGGDLFAA